MNVSIPVPARRLAVVLAALCIAQFAVAQLRSEPAAAKSAANAPLGDAPNLASFGVVEWLQRMHAASRQRSYVGTFVVSASAGNLSSARIWHVCEGDVQLERVEALTGPARSTFRRNDHVMTFLPDTKVVKSEKRENLELFPNLLGTPDSSVADFYGVRMLGHDRVAGFDADVVGLEPRDSLRFGYRIWSEHRSGLVVKLQTLDGDGKVVEQSAFSELQLDAPVKVHALSQMMQ
ncbi:MAG: transcriptional regulator, partial [Variovorax sp.]|nr:transcriptional regulator [Variovorax sp.]